MVQFFEEAIATFEPKVEGETDEFFELRKRETTTDLVVALQMLKPDFWSSNAEDYLLESYRISDDLVSL